MGKDVTFSRFSTFPTIIYYHNILEFDQITNIPRVRLPYDEEVPLQKLREGLQEEKGL